MKKKQLQKLQQEQIIYLQIILNDQLYKNNSYHTSGKEEQDRTPTSDDHSQKSSYWRCTSVYLHEQQQQRHALVDITRTAHTLADLTYHICQRDTHTHHGWSEKTQLLISLHTGLLHTFEFNLSAVTTELYPTCSSILLKSTQQSIMLMQQLQLDRSHIHH